MNKYQKALETLMSSNVKLCVYKDVDWEQQPSLFDLYHSELFALQELVEKETPKKAIWVPDSYGDMVQVCPNCKRRITNVWSSAEYKPKYCHFCGQKLDWGEDDE